MNYLNETGLQYFWGKIKDYVAENAGSGGGTVNWSNIQGKPSDLVTDVVISGSGNAVTNASFSSGTLTLTKGTISGGGTSGDYLPLTGGTMTGAIVSTSSTILSSEGSVYDLSITQGSGIVMNGGGNGTGYTQIGPGIITLANSANNALEIGGPGIRRLNPTGSNSSVWNTNGGITTFKTINGQSILGSGNIQIAGEGETVSDGNNYPTSLSTVITTNSATQAIITTTLNRSGLSAITDTVTLSGAVSESKAGLMTATDKRNLDYLWTNLGQEIEADNLGLDIYSSGNTLYSRLYNSDTMSTVIGNDSGVTLKTINGESIIGSGNITVSSDTGGITQTAADARYLKKAGDTCTGDLTINGQVVVGNKLSAANQVYSGTQLYSEGTIVAVGNVTASAFYENSDKNLKENISPISEEAIAEINCVNFKQFNFKADENKTTKYGVVAQDIEGVGLDNLVSTDDKGVKSVDYISLLILKIESLEKRIAELEAKNAN